MSKGKKRFWSDDEKREICTQLLCEGGCFLSQHPHAAQTIRSSCSLSGYCYAIPCRAVDVVEPTYSASRRQPPNPMKAAGALSRWSSPSALHHAETRLCTSLPFHFSFIANIARKRPEINRDKTNASLSRRGSGGGSRSSFARVHGPDIFTRAAHRSWQWHQWWLASTAGRFCVAG